MSNAATWDIVDWPKRPVDTDSYELSCNHCGTDAMMEIGPTPGGKIIAAIGLNIIFDPAGYLPPSNFMASTVRCRHCRRVFTDKE